MKLLFLIRSLDYGGAERQLVVLAKGLKQRGHDVAVTVFYAGGPLQKKLEIATIPVISLNKTGRWDLLPFFYRLLRTIYRQKPAVLHSYLGTSNILAALTRLFFPRLRTVWGVRISHLDLERYGRIHQLSYKIECFLARFADLIIANSYSGKYYAVKNGFPTHKIHVVPNGINTRAFTLAPEAGAALRAEWGVASDEKLIGLVGRFDLIKGHPIFLRAAALLAVQRNGLKFVCIGDGPTPYHEELLDLSKQLGLERKLIWAGNRADMPAVYNALDIACSASYSEGFSNVIGEAMACGVPCVVSNAGDSAKIVGDTGIVIKERSPEALSKGVQQILEKSSAEYDSLSALARRRIDENFSVAKLLELTENILWDRV